MVNDGTEVVSADIGGTTDEGILDELTTDEENPEDITTEEGTLEYGTTEERITVGDIEAVATTEEGVVVDDIIPNCVSLIDFMLLALSKLLAVLAAMASFNKFILLNISVNLSVTAI